jgi:hypothetical protein
MYRNLWSIGAKESMEFKDYTFQDHFGKELPSYLPRELHRRYLDGKDIIIAIINEVLILLGSHPYCGS